MKQTFYTLLLVIGLASTAHAQSSGVSFGIKAGGTLSGLVGADVTEYKSIPGFHGGVFANIGLTKMVAFQPEILYSQKGSKYPAVAISGPAGYITRRLHYVDVPLAFRINANNLFFEAGPQVGFLAGAQSKYEDNSFDIKDFYNSIDLGYLVGLGYQLESGLGIGLRYNGAFTNVRRSIMNLTDDRARNSAFQVYVSYSFNNH